MYQVKAVALSALLLSFGLSAFAAMTATATPQTMPAASASAPAEGAHATQGNAAQAPDAASPYDVSEFYSDPTRYKIGDIVPEMYRSKEYQIEGWKTRNLPAPDATQHWTYMGGFYVLVSNDQGKIIRIINSKIFY